MDIYRKELEEIYASQNLEAEKLPEEWLTSIIHNVAVFAETGSGCVVMTDAASDHCYIFGGRLGKAMGFFNCENGFREEFSSDEDSIYFRVHPEDLVDKRLLEYEFFRFIDRLNIDSKARYKATCRIRMKDSNGEYRVIHNSTRVIRLSPNGKIWLIMCCYDYAETADRVVGIHPSIVDLTTGDVRELNLTSRRTSILSQREKEILKHIKEGLPSKLIADRLNISLHTVNRHRQNIIAKLSVSNSIEAVTAAQQMGLLR